MPVPRVRRWNCKGGARMKTLRLMSLDIENFKGITKRTIRLDGANAAIYGENGAGKTSHYDALCWLLFGKDSHGNMPDTPDFAIKPRGTSGTGVMPTVTAVLQLDGVPTTLRKVYKELWTKKRGSSEAEFAGNTTECYVDDVPRKAGEYAALVGELVDEKIFQTLTNVYAVPTMRWQDRRALLFEICGMQTDATLLASDPMFSALADACGKLSIDDYKTAQKLRRRKLNETLSELPARIDECEKTVSSYSGMDFVALEAQIKTLMSERLEVSGALARLENDTEKATVRNTIDRLRNDLRALENENAAHRRSQEIPVTDPRDALRRELDSIQRERKSVADQIAAAESENKMADMRLDEYRNAYKAIAKEQFTADTCRTCGQKLPADRLEAAKSRFTHEQQQRKDRLLADSNLIKDGMRARNERIAELRPQRDELLAREKELSAQIAAAQAPKAQIVEDLPDYQARAAQRKAQIEQAENALSGILAGSTEQRYALESRLRELDDRYYSTQCELAKKEVLEEARTRAEVHRQSQKTVAVELEQVDRMIALCEEFTRFKADSLTEAVNRRFEGVSFRLFRQQKNGGLEDCCDIMLDDKPYGTCSDGEKVKIGLSIIGTMSTHYGIRVPLFVDGAESVTGFPFMDTQVIRLVVSEADQELRYGT